jgi:hypothetical protein
MDSFFMLNELSVENDFRKHQEKMFSFNSNYFQVTTKERYSLKCIDILEHIKNRSFRESI